MYVEKREMQEAMVLDCFGRFEEEDHDHFMEIIEGLNDRECPFLVVNLSSVYRLDGPISNLLTFAHELYTLSGSQMVLVSPVSAIRKELELVNIPQKIPTYLSVYDALHRRASMVAQISLNTTSGKSPENESNDMLFGEDQGRKEVAVASKEMVGAGNTPTKSVQ